MTSFEYNGKTYAFDIKRVGQEYCSPNKKYVSRKQSYYSLHFIMYGLGTLCVGDKKVTLGKGDVFLLWEDEAYEYYPDNFDPWSYVWVDFVGDGFSEMLAACGFTKNKPYFHVNDYPDMVEIIRNLLAGYDSSATQSMVCSACFMLFISRLATYANRHAPVSVRGSKRFKQFRDILIYVNSNYRMNFTLDELAETMHVSRKQLMAMFRDYTGYTPINYINKMRMSQACVLLKNTDYKILAIAEMVGMNSEKYFTRLFTKTCGVSPREYRKSGGDEDPYGWLKEKQLYFLID